MQQSYKRVWLTHQYSIGINALQVIKLKSGRLPITKLCEKFISVGFTNFHEHQNTPSLESRKSAAAQNLQRLI